MKEFLGEEGFAGLRIMDRKIPSPGEIILSESHGLRLETIASNLKRFVAQLDEDINAYVRATEDDRSAMFLYFMGKFDDLADVGSRQIEHGDVRALVTNLLEYNLALINELQQQLSPEAINQIIKRFSAREALRGVNLRPYIRVSALELS